MARPHSQAGSQDFDSAIFQSTLANQSESAGNCIGSTEPGWRSGRTLRAATQARTEAGYRRGGRSREVTNIFFFGRRRGADRSAVNATGLHSDEELAIETRIARQACTRTGLPVQPHILIFMIAPSFGAD